MLLKKKSVVFFGTKKIGLDCLKILNQNQTKLNYTIKGVLTNKNSSNILKYSQKNNLKILRTLDDYLKLRFVDILISVQYHLILNLEHIKKASELAVNLHMAPLPEYRGCNQFSFAIIEEKKFFGTTIHKIDKGIDNGDILFESRFKIPKNCWIEDLYNLTYKKSIELFKESLPKIISLNFIPISQKNLIRDRGCSLHLRKEINNLKKINLSWSKNKIEKHIRATSMKGFEPPYFEVNKKKFLFIKDQFDD